MIVCRSRGFAFVHVPKTGGSSITAALAPIVGVEIPEDYPMSWQAKFHNEGGLHTGFRSRGMAKDLFSFGFTRNPFDLWASRWYSSNVRLDGPTFEEFVIDWSRSAMGRKSLHDHLTCPGTGKRVTYVGRFEIMDFDWRQICERLHLGPITLPKLNVRPKHPRWQDIHTKRTIKIIREIHEPDFREFHYEK